MNDQGEQKRIRSAHREFRGKKKKKKAVEAAMCSCFLLKLHRRSTSRKMV